MSQNARDTDSHIGRRLKLRDLQILASVAQHGSMAKAAAQLSTTQPTVSQPPPPAGARLNALALSLHRAHRSRQRCRHPDVQAAEFGRLAVLRRWRHGKKLSVPGQFDNVS
jgi:Bacterial regulatory helix-turn-helix protein, lysR family